MVGYFSDNIDQVIYENVRTNFMNTKSVRYKGVIWEEMSVWQFLSVNVQEITKSKC